MRGISEILSIRDTKSGHNIVAGSIPKVQRSGELELYVRKREKDRLEREIFALDKRRKTVERQLNGVCERIDKLQKETCKERIIKAYSGKTPKKQLKTVAIKY